MHCIVCWNYVFYVLRALHSTDSHLSFRFYLSKLYVNKWTPPRFLFTPLRTSHLTNVVYKYASTGTSFHFIFVSVSFASASVRIRIKNMPRPSVVVIIAIAMWLHTYLDSLRSSNARSGSNLKRENVKAKLWFHSDESEKRENNRNPHKSILKRWFTVYLLNSHRIVVTVHTIRLSSYHFRSQKLTFAQNSE